MRTDATALFVPFVKIRRAEFGSIALEGNEITPRMAGC